MKIALDLDGTVTKYPHVFRLLVENTGHLIDYGILTARFNARQRDLDWLKQQQFPELKFHICRYSHDIDMETRTWKHKMMQQYSINFLIDDLDTHKVIFLLSSTDLQDLEGRNLKKVLRSL